MDQVEALSIPETLIGFEMDQHSLDTFTLNSFALSVNGFGQVA